MLVELWKRERKRKNKKKVLWNTASLVVEIYFGSPYLDLKYDDDGDDDDDDGDDQKES